ncbi:MAG: YafY family transcriptional regulator [Sneathiella sp.]|nr:YafY family transcriptional regulator [Sneathiella sp.]
MRRAERLFQIIQVLQRNKSVVTAQAIAQELEVSTRTIYRDIQDLMANRVPIRGEAGMGYILDQGFDMPPMMLSEEEIDAVMLGIQWVKYNGDPHISRASENVLSKIEAVLPPDRRRLMHSARQVIPKFVNTTIIHVSMPDVRSAIRQQQKAKTCYQTPNGILTERIVCPLLIVFFESIQLLVAWCELRQDFRNFRMDRFKSFDLLGTPFSDRLFDRLDAYIETQKTTTWPKPS